jgi:hypothetical protein
MFIVIGILLFLFLWIKIESNVSNRKIEKDKADFWNKEYQANSSRKVDISGLAYIIIPLDKLPMVETPDEELNEIQKTMKHLSTSSILNLTGLTNTDIKLKYGVANLTYLSECDNNYTLLVQTLYKWGNYLYNQNMLAESLTVLEFGVQCKTEVTKHYILLANLYKQMNMSYKIDDLVHQVESLQTLLKDNTLSVLKNI